MNMISAQEALAQGSTPSLFFSVASANRDKEIVRVAKARAAELAGMLGMDLGGWRPRSDVKQPKPRRRDGGE
jgi:hypothetical protein